MSVEANTGLCHMTRLMKIRARARGHTWFEWSAIVAILHRFRDRRARPLHSDRSSIWGPVRGDRRPNFVTAISQNDGAIRQWNNFDHLYIRLAVLIQFRSVTDRQTYGQNCYISVVRCIHVWTECRILLQKYHASLWQGVRTHPTPHVCLRHWVKRVGDETSRREQTMGQNVHKSVKIIIDCLRWKWAMWLLTAPGNTRPHRARTGLEPGQKWLIILLWRRINRHKMSYLSAIDQRNALQSTLVMSWLQSRHGRIWCFLLIQFKPNTRGLRQMPPHAS